MNATTDGPQRLDALTGLRGLASAWVLLFHLIPEAASVLPRLSFLRSVASTGYLGVDLFFVLSGFVLVLSHGREFSTRPNSNWSRDYPRFLALRLARIYPVHLFVLLCLLSVSVAAHVVGTTLDQTGTARDFFQQIILVHGWGFAPHLSWNGPSWSISSEWAAYLAFPIFALCAGRVRNRALALACSAAAMVLVLVIYSRTSMGQPALTFVDPLPRVLGEFGAGCLLCVALRDAPTARLSRRFDQARAWLAPIALLAVVAGGTALTRNGHSAFWLAPLLLLVILGTATRSGFWARFLSSPRMVRAGTVSYCLYMTHDPVLLVYEHVWGHPGLPTAAVWIIVLSSAPVMYLTATIVYRLVERPAQLWVRRSLPARRTVGSSA